MVIYWVFVLGFKEGGPETFEGTAGRNRRGLRIILGLLSRMMGVKANVSTREDKIGMDDCELAVKLPVGIR